MNYKKGKNKNKRGNWEIEREEHKYNKLCVCMLNYV